MHRLIAARPHVGVLLLVLLLHGVACGDDESTPASTSDLGANTDAGASGDLAPVDLSGTDLSNGDVSNADISNSDIANADMPDFMEMTASAMIGSEGGTIVLGDGLFTLEIPAGALDETTEITLTRVSIDVLPDPLPEFEMTVDAVIDLQPDGLVFALPATATYRLPLEAERGVPAGHIVHITGDGDASFLSGVVIERSEDDQLGMRGELDHFSLVLPLLQASVNVRLEPVTILPGSSVLVYPRIVIDGSTDSSRRLTIHRPFYTFEEERLRYFLEQSERLTLRSPTNAEWQDALLKKVALSRPLTDEYVAVTISGDLIPSAVVDCVSEGTVNLSVHVEATLEYDSDSVISNGLRALLGEPGDPPTLVAKTTIECVAPRPPPEVVVEQGEPAFSSFEAETRRIANAIRNEERSDQHWVAVSDEQEAMMRLREGIPELSGADLDGGTTELRFTGAPDLIVDFAVGTNGGQSAVAGLAEDGDAIWIWQIPDAATVSPPLRIEFPGLTDIIELNPACNTPAQSGCDSASIFAVDGSGLIFVFNIFEPTLGYEFDIGGALDISQSFCTTDVLLPPGIGAAPSSIVGCVTRTAENEVVYRNSFGAQFAVPSETTGSVLRCADGACFLVGERSVEAFSFSDASLPPTPRGSLSLEAEHALVPGASAVVGSAGGVVTLVATTQDGQLITFDQVGNIGIRLTALSRLPTCEQMQVADAVVSRDGSGDPLALVVCSDRAQFVRFQPSMRPTMCDPDPFEQEGGRVVYESHNAPEGDTHTELSLEDATSTPQVIAIGGTDRIRIPTTEDGRPGAFRVEVTFQSPFTYGLYLHALAGQVTDVTLIQEDPPLLRATALVAASEDISGLGGFGWTNSLTVAWDMKFGLIDPNGPCITYEVTATPVAALVEEDALESNNTVLDATQLLPEGGVGSAAGLSLGTTDLDTFWLDGSYTCSARGGVPVDPTGDSDAIFDLPVDVQSAFNSDTNTTFIAVRASSVPVPSLELSCHLRDDVALADGESACEDGEDNDGDGRVDCDDPDCECPMRREICDNNLDDDGNRLVDCGDPACAQGFAGCVTDGPGCDVAVHGDACFCPPNSNVSCDTSEVVALGEGGGVRMFSGEMRGDTEVWYQLMGCPGLLDITIDPGSSTISANLLRAVSSGSACDAPFEYDDFTSRFRVGVDPAQFTTMLRITNEEPMCVDFDVELALDCDGSSDADPCLPDELGECATAVEDCFNDEDDDDDNKVDCDDDDCAAVCCANEAGEPPFGYVDAIFGSFTVNLSNIVCLSDGCGNYLDPQGGLRELEYGVGNGAALLAPWVLHPWPIPQNIPVQASGFIVNDFPEALEGEARFVCGESFGDAFSTVSFDVPAFEEGGDRPILLVDRNGALHQFFADCPTEIADTMWLRVINISPGVDNVTVTFEPGIVDPVETALFTDVPFGTASAWIQPAAGLTFESRKLYGIWRYYSGAADAPFIIDSAGGFSSQLVSVAKVPEAGLCNTIIVWEDPEGSTTNQTTILLIEDPSLCENYSNLGDTGLLNTWDPETGCSYE